MAYEIGTNDAVFTTNFSFFATAEAISLVGATPIFVDIDSVTFNISPESLEIKIKDTLSNEKARPKAIIAVDLFGQLADYDKISKIAKKYNLILIEDAAQSFGASYKNKKSCSFGDIAATSFYPAKPLGCYGDGGAIFTNNKRISEICKSIRVHGQDNNDKYDNIRLGLNSRLDTLQAVVLLNKLKIFDNELILRNQIAINYSNELNQFLKIPTIKNNHVSSWAQYSLLAKNKIERDELIKFLNQHAIPTAVFYKKPFNALEIYKSNDNDEYPNSKEVSKHIFSIPMHPYLNEKEIEKIIKVIKMFY